MGAGSIIFRPSWQFLGTTPKGLAWGLARRINAHQFPLIPGGIETDVEVITSTADCVTENHGFTHPLQMNQIGRGYVISTRIPSKRSKEGVRGPAAVDHERIDGFSNLLEHVRTHKAVYEMLGGRSIAKN